MTSDPNEEPASSSETAFRIAALFVVAALVLAVLFAVYVLAWDGGAHT